PARGRRGRRWIHAVQMEEPARGDDGGIELLGPDRVRRRAAGEAGAEPRAGGGQHDADVGPAAPGPERRAHVPPPLRRESPAEPRPVVVAELADVAGAEAEPRARDHRGRDHAAALDLERPEGGLRVGRRMAVDHAEEIERVRPEPHDVDPRRWTSGPDAPP